MKKAVATVLVLMLALSGCGGADENMERGLTLRAKLLAARSCSFTAKITADYGAEIHEFSVSCQADAHGNLNFTVLSPESIAGITGKVSETGGALTFDATALAFPLLADGQVTPVSAPWLLFKTLRGGYIASAGMEDEYLRLSIDDSYADDALRMDIWVDSTDSPVQADILYGGRRILTLEVKDFEIV